MPADLGPNLHLAVTGSSRWIFQHDGQFVGLDLLDRDRCRWRIGGLDARG
jgi:hypothetical protein